MKITKEILEAAKKESEDGRLEPRRLLSIATIKKWAIRLREAQRSSFGYSPRRIICGLTLNLIWGEFTLGEFTGEVTIHFEWFRGSKGSPLTDRRYEREESNLSVFLKIWVKMVILEWGISTEQRDWNKVAIHFDQSHIRGFFMDLNLYAKSNPIIGNYIYF